MSLHDEGWHRGWLETRKFVFRRRNFQSVERETWSNKVGDVNVMRVSCIFCCSRHEHLLPVPPTSHIPRETETLSWNFYTNIYLSPESIASKIARKISSLLGHITDSYINIFSKESETLSRISGGWFCSHKIWVKEQEIIFLLARCCLRKRKQSNTRRDVELRHAMENENARSCRTRSEHSYCDTRQSFSRGFWSPALKR